MSALTDKVVALVEHLEAGGAKVGKSALAEVRAFAERVKSLVGDADNAVSKASDAVVAEADKVEKQADPEN